MRYVIKWRYMALEMLANYAAQIPSISGNYCYLALNCDHKIACDLVTSVKLLE